MNLTLASADYVAQVEGVVTMRVIIKGVEFQADFHILPKLRHYLILGDAFFRRHRASFCYTRRCVSLETTRRVTAYWNQIQKPQLYNVQLPEFPEDTPEEIREVYEEFEDLFQAGLKQSTTISTYHQIPLKKDAVIHKRAYPMSPDKKNILQDQIQEMLRACVIEPSTSPFSRPGVGNAPREKAYILCGLQRLKRDYRGRVNGVTKNFRSAERIG